ncbi:fimbrial protein [Metapseudomonas otitidis]|uniref:fimbrial protein n=1 Tax=Metapseudomonas otitidis TaxID=319939 RepID=UPI0013F669ED|nr:fimbrial protein [Pseudomonas otitidis]
MIRKLMASAAVVALSAASLTAFAANAGPDTGEIRFNGKIVEKTCTVAVNGVVSPAIANVTLPEANASLLQLPGNTTGDTPFTISVKDCLTNSGQAQVVFYSSNSDGNYLRNIAATDPADNALLELTDNNGNPLDLIGGTSTGLTLTAGQGSAVYKVRYYAKAAVTPGAVESTATYVISYP